MILAVGILAMLAVQITALKQGRYGRHTTTASQVARDQMELLTRLPWADARVQPTAWTTPANVSTMVQGSGGNLQEQAFALRWRITTTGLDPNLRQIDVDVQWNEADARSGAPARRYAISSMKHNDPVAP
jgi:Tfp pilus assembly protein PilV